MVSTGRMPRALLVIAGMVALSGHLEAAGAAAIFEAEAGQVGGGATVVAEDSASGGHCVRFPAKVGSVGWTVELPEAGRYDVFLRYRASGADRAQVLRINEVAWPVGFTRTGDGWLECRRTFSFVRGANRLELVADRGEMDVDLLRFSVGADGGPAPVYELPALSPRHTVVYGSDLRGLAYKVDLNGHVLKTVLLDGVPVSSTQHLFPSWPDAVRVEVAAAELAKSPAGEHAVELVMEDGSRAAGTITVRTVAEPAPLTIVGFDVGHGKATLFCLPNGEVALVDTGSPAAAAERVVPFLRRHGIKRIDHLILTHYHDDHVGGLEAIKATFVVGRVLDYRSFKTGDEFALGGVQVKVLNAYDAGDDENRRSLALRWSYGRFSCSDGADTYAVNQQAARRRFPESIRSDVYFANHHFHGSVDVDFLRQVDATLFVVSAQEAIYARGAYEQIFRGEVEPHLRAAGSRFRETLLTHEVGNVVIRVREGGAWDYESYAPTPDLIVPALR